MSKLEAYTRVMILGMVQGKERYDRGGVYIGIEHRGSKKGLYKVKIDDVILHVTENKVMDYEEYYRIYWKKTDKKFPPEAAGIPWFLTGDHKGSF
jgi:uncharacterized protein (UPF0248 family)